MTVFPEDAEVVVVVVVAVVVVFEVSVCETDIDESDTLSAFACTAPVQKTTEAAKSTPKSAALTVLHLITSSLSDIFSRLFCIVIFYYTTHFSLCKAKKRNPTGCCRVSLLSVVRNEPRAYIPLSEEWYILSAEVRL